MNKWLTILMIITFSLSACQHKKGNFSVTIPANWIVKDTVDMEHERKLKIHAPMNSAASIIGDNIIISIHRYKNANDYLTGVLKGVKDEASFFKKKDQGTITIDQHKAVWAQCLVEFVPKTMISEQIIYCVGDNGNVYQIVCTGMPDHMQDIQKEIDTVLNSFKILH